MPIAFIGIAKVAGGFKLGNNHAPRAFLNKAQGKAFLAKSAHDNSWEAFAPFAVAVLFCLQTGVNETLVNRLSGSFVFLRLIYGILYIIDKPTLRSIVWALAWFITAFLFYKAWSYSPEPWYQKFF